MNQPKYRLITFIGFLVTLVASGVCAYLVSHVALAWQISLGLAALFFVAFIFLSFTKIMDSLSQRTTQFGLNALIMSVLALAIVVIANMIAVEYDKKLDLTKNKLHTLSDQSIKLVKGLTEDVTFKIFAGPAQVQEFEQILSKYTYHSKHLKKEFVDVDKDPLVVEKYQIKQPGTIIIESASRTAKVDNLMGPDDPKVEEKITNAIIQVSKGQKKKVYFITGHGERLASDSGREGYSQVKESLTQSRYEVADLVLLEKDKMPEDAEIVVCAGPKSDFMPQELQMLESYVRKGGKLLLMVEPTSSATLKDFLAKFGAAWKPHTAVVEVNPLQQRFGGNPLTPIVLSYDGSHQITQEARQLSIFPVASPIEKAGSVPNNLTVTSLFSTSSKSLEATLKGNDVKADPKTDRKGPLSLALAVVGKVEEPAVPKKEEPKKDEKAATPEATAEAEKKTKEFRVVIVGDADFAANGVQGFGINNDLFQNMMSWLAHEEDLISIRPRPTDEAKFEITVQRARIITFASMGIALSMLISGVIVSLSRRRK